MNKFGLSLGLGALTVVLSGAAAYAGGVVAPAPLLGAGLPGAAILVIAGGGYLAVRAFRRRD
jgi:hypothetical protein